MRRVAIRHVTGSLIQAAANDGEDLAITNDRVVCALLRPIDRDAVDALVDRSISRIARSVDLAEHQLASEDRPLWVLGADRSGASGPGLSATAVGERPADRSPVRLSIRELSGAAIQEAATAGRRIALTNGHVLCALVEPISVDWVNGLVEDHLSRLVTTAGRAESDVDLGARLSTLDEVVGQAARA